MRPHIHRIRTLRPLRPPNRFFTQFERPRPQLPFLSQPSRRANVRWLTTERKNWIKSEFKVATKFTVGLWAVVGLGCIIVYGVGQEIHEREFPTPPEWSFLTRENLRTAKFYLKAENDDAYGIANWPLIGGKFRTLVNRLEDPAIDGKDLKEQDEGGILVEGVGKTGYDITAKSEPWRRGYYEALMGAAHCAEFLENYVKDKTRSMSFPANSMIGPSNPRPVPLPPGSPVPPQEKDCEQAYLPPQAYYMRVLTTRGFTDRQRLDAALAYAVYLDYKGTPIAAADMFKWALDIAKSSTPNAEKLFDGNGAISTKAGAVSDNILTATTALAVHHARNDNITAALPIFLSVLRARRSLPSEDPQQALDSAGQAGTPGFMSLVKLVVTPPKYPPPPSDGTSTPSRNAKERCEEAALMVYIGEILYASSKNAAGREDGLAWTREAVDISEVELRGHAGVNNKEANKVCKMCLDTGLSNWATMVSRLAEEEREKNLVAPKKVGGWLGFGGEIQQESVGRWESEESVVKDRARRAEDVLTKS